MKHKDERKAKEKRDDEERMGTRNKRVMKQNLGPVSIIFVSLLKLHLSSLGGIEGREIKK